MGACCNRCRNRPQGELESLEIDIRDTGSEPRFIMYDLVAQANPMAPEQYSPSPMVQVNSILDWSQKQPVLFNSSNGVLHSIDYPLSNADPASSFNAASIHSHHSTPQDLPRSHNSQLGSYNSLNTSKGNASIKRKHQQQIMLPDGSVYTGAVMDGNAHGYGVLRMVDDSSKKYEGNWVSGLQCGRGKLVMSDGSSYVGDFVDGRKQGKGILHMKDGSSYNGEFNQNMLEGLGIFIWADRRHYTGTWVANKMQGRGFMMSPDGRAYEGSYHSGKKHGQGTYTWHDGRKYIGPWVNGKQHGVGMLIDNKGMLRKGEWCQGERIRWIQDCSGLSSKPETDFNQFSSNQTFAQPYLLSQRKK